MKKTGRNDPCVCGSGKKFKKCCENKMIGKRFMATKIEAPKTSISSFFQKKIIQISETEKTPSKQIKAEIKTKQKPLEENVAAEEKSPVEINSSNETQPQKS